MKIRCHICWDKVDEGDYHPSYGCYDCYMDRQREESERDRQESEHQEQLQREHQAQLGEQLQRELERQYQEEMGDK